MNMDTKTDSKINGIDTAALEKLVGAVSADPREGEVKFEVTTSWKGGTRSETRVEAYELAGQRYPRSFTMSNDEPEQLCGGNSAPNPQEMLMGAFNACILVGYVAGCAMKGIRLEKVEVRTEGQLDLRGFFGLDENVKPGYDQLSYRVNIKGDGTPEAFAEVHEMVKATSPNRWNLAQPVRLEGQLVVE
jgi:uncharacterized OsmC-like protein